MNMVMNEADAESAFTSALVEKGVLNAESARRLLAARTNSQHPFDIIVTELGLLSEQKLADELCMWHNLSTEPGQDAMPDKELIEILGYEFLKNFGAIPVRGQDDRIVIELADPFSISSLDAIQFALDEPIEINIFPRSFILEKLSLQTFPMSSDVEEETSLFDTDYVSAEDVDRLQDIASEAPVIRYLNNLVQSAADNKATDIHLEPFGGQAQFRIRVDGILRNAGTIDRVMYAGIVGRIKVLASLNIAERRRPQDGRLRMSVRGENIDLRVSILPSINGETVVLRLLDKSSVPLDLDRLGFSPDAHRKLIDLARVPNGIILATGPTGSGKTTTLYALLKQIMSPQSKIFTIEDPVEYKLDGVVQLQVDHKIDMTFAAALRSVLRQDPDIVLVGEIRDKETAEIAMRAALTGHLVFSTLHTNSSTEAITRLRDMGIDNFLLAATIRGIIAQRLLRKKCENCTDTSAHACTSCAGTGYSGRVVCYETLRMSERLSDAVSAGEPSNTIFTFATNDGMVPLQAHAEELVKSNMTSTAEIHRMISLGGM